MAGVKKDRKPWEWRLQANPCCVDDELMRSRLRSLIELMTSRYQSAATANTNSPNTVRRIVI